MFTAITAVALLAGMLVDLGQPRTAALLGGVLTGGPYAAYFLLVTAPEDRHELDDQLAVVRARLGDDEYEQAIAHGAGMSLDGVIDTMVTAIDEALHQAALWHRLPIAGRQSFRLWFERRRGEADRVVESVAVRLAG